MALSRGSWRPGVPSGHSPLVAITQLRPYSGMPRTSLSGPPAASVEPAISSSTQSSGAIGPGSATE